MNRWILCLGAMLLTHVALSQTAEEIDQPEQRIVVAHEEPLGSLLPETGVPPTESITVEMLSDDAFKESVRRLPQLMEKIRVENFAADNPYVLLPHRPNYFMPVTWYSNPGIHSLITTDESSERVAESGDYQHFESIFQLSIKYPIATGVLGSMSRLDIAYTNRSFWQMYNEDISRPFRETNHEPELILTWQTRNKYIDYVSTTLNHHSNGQSGKLSRSWNRVILEAGAVFSNGLLNTKLWWRMPEPSKTAPLGDDNPDITHYMGYGQLQYIFLHGDNTVSVKLRNNLKASDNKGAIEIGYNFPLHKKIKGYIHYFNGYGESLIDYDNHQQRIGIGIKLSDWL